MPFCWFCRCPHEESLNHWPSKMLPVDSGHTANAQSDLNHHWAHMFEGMFSDVLAESDF